MASESVNIHILKCAIEYQLCKDESYLNDYLNKNNFYKQPEYLTLIKNNNFIIKYKQIVNQITVKKAQDYMKSLNRDKLIEDAKNTDAKYKFEQKKYIDLLDNYNRIKTLESKSKDDLINMKKCPCCSNSIKSNTNQIYNDLTKANEDYKIEFKKATVYLCDSFLLYIYYKECIDLYCTLIFGSIYRTIVEKYRNTNDLIKIRDFLVDSFEITESDITIGRVYVNIHGGLRVNVKGITKIRRCGVNLFDDLFPGLITTPYLKFRKYEI